MHLFFDGQSLTIVHSQNVSVMTDLATTVLRYSDEDLEEFRVLIEKKLKKAKDELDFYASQLSELTESSDSKIKSLDDGIGTSENERLSIMAQRQKKFIQNLESALLRIQNKSFGVCRVTGQLIDKNRLKAVPHATLSIEAKEQKLG